MKPFDLEKSLILHYFCKNNISTRHIFQNLRKKLRTIPRFPASAEEQSLKFSI